MIPANIPQEEKKVVGWFDSQTAALGRYIKSFNERKMIPGNNNYLIILC